MKILREYNKYEDYVSHQKEKTLNHQRREDWLKNREERIQMFYNHFERVKNVFNAGRALCVCARMGEEVEALRKHGMGAIGIDLVPYLPWVIEGDAHSIPFEDNEFDFVFSNSFDHSIVPDVFVAEMLRVLKIDGFGVLHLQVTEDVDVYAENTITNPYDVASYFEICQVYKLEDDIYNYEILFKK